MHQRAGNGQLPHDLGAGRRYAGLGSRRVIGLSFAVSLVAHAALVLLYPLFAPEVPSATPDFAFPEFTGPPDGMEVIRIVEVDDLAEAERPDEPEVVERLERPRVTLQTPELEGRPDPDLRPPPPTAAERLRPHLRDARLWAPVDPALTELTTEQREELLIAGRLEAWRDSVEAALEAESALTDWTHTDAEGRRWGVSPGKLHLGDITLPLPFSFGTNPGKRDEVNRRLWEWDEIVRQGAQAEIRESWKERAEAIRERRDRERAATKPDTVRGRR